MAWARRLAEGLDAAKQAQLLTWLRRCADALAET